MAEPTGDEKDQYSDDEYGWARRWSTEFGSARKQLEPWWRRGEKVIDRFKDKRDASMEDTSKLNLFTSDTITKKAIVYGKTPQVDAVRRFGDANDDVARVGAEMLERILNTDIEKDSDTYATALGYALDDWIKPGLGNCRLRYVCEFEEVAEVPAQLDEETQEELAPAVPAQKKKCYECVETDYVHWKDQLWSAGARVFHEVKWWAFKTQMTRGELVKRFGDIGKLVPLGSKKTQRGQPEDPWSRADVWEICWKEGREHFWYVEGFDQILDRKPDMLELEGFWPFPKPLMSNLSTDELVPVPDFTLAQDLYNEIDLLTHRISLLEEAIRVAYVYDKSAGEVHRLLSEGGVNRGIPVDKWPAFSEKGGLKGVMDFLPLDMIVGALDKLEQQRTSKIGLLQQVTGMADIMRGAAQQNATATEQAIKARFASVRVQTMQDEFARFASDIQALKAEIISRHFDPESILKESNIGMTGDMQMAMQAVQLIKSDPRGFRIQVKPESVNLQDMTALKQERTDVIQTLGGFFQAMMPMVQIMGPSTLPFVLQIGQWLLSSIRGGGEAEGIFDRAVAQAQQAAMQPKPPPPPDPKLQVAQMKIQGDMQKTQFEHQADMQHIGAELQADVQREQVKHHMGMQSAEQQERLKALRAVNEVVGGQP